MASAGESRGNKPARRTRDAAGKRALLTAYDKATASRRSALLEREGITARHISRWRAETKDLAPAPGSDDELTTHVEALVFHAEAIERLVAATTTTNTAAGRRDRAALKRLVAAAEVVSKAASEVVVQRSEPSPGEPSTPERGRRPWWGDPAAPPAAPTRPRRRDWTAPQP
jgi:hypothetical protein